MKNLIMITFSESKSGATSFPGVVTLFTEKDVQDILGHSMDGISFEELSKEGNLSPAYPFL